MKTQSLIERIRKPSHPGRVFLRDVMEPLGLQVTETAKKLNVSHKHLSAFVNEKNRCSLDMAQRLAIATNTSVVSWLNLQTELDTWDANHNLDPKYTKVREL